MLLRRGIKAATKSPDSLVRVYRQEVDRQKLLVKKSHIAEHRLLFISSAISQLFRDSHFVALLKSEGLADLPAYLAERVQPSERTS
jgi:ParB family chromosome partitioning protein